MLDQTGVLNSNRINNEHISLFLQSGQMLKVSFRRKMVRRSHKFLYKKTNSTVSVFTYYVKQNTSFKDMFGHIKR